MKNRNWAEYITAKIVKILMFVILAVAVIGFITMSLWNWLVPELFHGPTITFWQTLGLLLLSKIFLWAYAKGHGHHGAWRPYWKQKWNSMNPEERERFKQKMKEKWCNWSDPSSTQTVENQKP